MTHGLLVIVPTRGRPGRARELITAVRDTGATAHLTFGVDDDDPELAGYQQLERARHPGVTFRYGPRQDWVTWTNQIATASTGNYRALASLGDDHRPRTHGWDAALLGALDATGGTGFAYGEDWLQGERVPTSVVMSSAIVDALGWMCLPSLKHYYADDVWRFLADGAGCRHYLPRVVIEHEHPIVTGAHPDATYREAMVSYQDDRATFRKWRGSADAAAAVEAIRCLMPVPVP